jgi:Abnormal spindle-like microcephaly-assoc'd, ASPM-SPD-2-Hydin
MPLPQSIIQSLFVRTVHFLTIGMAILLFGMVPVRAGAATLQLACTPTNLRFGAVVVGQTETLLVTLTNNGQSSVTVSGIAVGKSEFTTSNLSLPLVLLAGQSVDLSVSFTPTAMGWTGGTIKFFSNASNATLHLDVEGTGVRSESVTASPSMVSFGQVAIGTISTVPVVLTNARSWKVTLSALQTTSGGFSMSGPMFPLTLGAGQSVTLNVAFAPQSAGTTGGSLFVSGPQLAIPLTGTGTAPGQLSANPSSLNFANVPVGSSQMQSATLTNSGGSSLTVSQATLTGTSFTLSGLTLPLTLGAGQSATFSVVFAPQSAGSVSGNVAFTSNASNPAMNLPLSGTGVTGGTLTANPTSLAFGSVQVAANSASLSETLTNSGGSTITISQANLTGAVFSVSGLTLPLTLTASQSVTFTATFAPTSAGAASRNLSVVSNASNSPLNIALSGTGTSAGQLAVSPTSLSFGNVVVGSSASLNGSLNASGASVTVTSASLTNGEFVLSGISLPATIPAGQSATFTVTFTPGASGGASASLSFSSNAANSPAVQSMTGTGTAPAPHTVDLTWNASANAVGYNVYRSTVSGGPYSMINTSLDATTAYTDTTVSSGQTYYYVTTAVNGSSNESGYSNQSQAVIPNP